jgi:hypothetical protein
VLASGASRCRPQGNMIDIGDPADLERFSDDADLKRLHRYWTERRGERLFPSRADIDPVDFGYALGRISLVDVLDGPRFRYRLVATRLTDHLGYEMTGKFLDELPDAETRDYARRFYVEALARRRPLHHREAVVLDDRRWRQEALILPLSSDGEGIDMLLVYRVTGQPVPTTTAPG